MRKVHGREMKGIAQEPGVQLYLLVASCPPQTVPIDIFRRFSKGGILSEPE